MSKKKDGKILLTKEGFETLEAEYKDLTEVQRPDVLRTLQASRELGDLSENGMYSAAREKQSFIEGRIQEIEGILKKVEVAETPSGEDGNVMLGSKVKIETQKQVIEYSIVGQEEVDAAEGKISHESPLGQALIGKKIGDEIEFEAPMGIVKYKVVEIR